MWVAVVVALALTAVYVERVDRATALYFALVTVSTVGFGDVAPVTPTGRALVAVLVLVSALTASATLGMVFARVAPPPARALQLLFALAVGATSVLVAAEQLTVADALYMVATTLTTVGYGDVVPRSVAGRATVAVLAVAGTTLLALVGAHTSAWVCAPAAMESARAGKSKKRR